MVNEIYKIRSEISVAPSPEIWQPKTSNYYLLFFFFLHEFTQFYDSIVNISRTQQDIVNRKTALQTTNTPTQANLIRCTLVDKRWRIGPEFWPIQRAAIRLGIAAHPVSLWNPLLIPSLLSHWRRYCRRRPCVWVCLSVCPQPQLHGAVPR